MTDHADDCEGCNQCDEALMDLDPMEKYFAGWRTRD